VIGGGIAQDIGTFAAHIYYRGIAFHFVPTTLLSMADSCIGAKCGVNLGSFKNQLGFFQSPQSVHIWPGFVETLRDEDVRSGFGEIVKLAIIGGLDDFSWVGEQISRTGLSREIVESAIFRSLAIKQRVIEADEYENGLRKILNYGHTFGHALESITHHEVPHGLAVAWGLDAANYIAMRNGTLKEKTFGDIHEFLAKHLRFSVQAPYSAREIVRAMSRDKKAADGVVTLVLLSEWGKLDLEPRKLDAAFETEMARYIAEVDLFK
jgi:3-dehydroquinate synthase